MMAWRYVLLCERSGEDAMLLRLPRSEQRPILTSVLDVAEHNVFYPLRTRVELAVEGEFTEDVGPAALGAVRARLGEGSARALTALLPVEAHRPAFHLQNTKRTVISIFKENVGVSMETIKIPQRTRLLKTDCCLKVHNLHSGFWIWFYIKARAKVLSVRLHA